MVLADNAGSCFGTAGHAAEFGKKFSSGPVLAVHEQYCRSLAGCGAARDQGPPLSEQDSCRGSALITLHPLGYSSDLGIQHCHSRTPCPEIRAIWYHANQVVNFIDYMSSGHYGRRQ